MLEEKCFHEKFISEKIYLNILVNLRYIHMHFLLEVFFLSRSSHYNHVKP